MEESQNAQKNPLQQTMGESLSSQKNPLQQTMITYIKTCMKVYPDDVSDVVLQKIIGMLGSCSSGSRLQIIAAAALSAVCANNAEMADLLIRMGVLTAVKKALSFADLSRKEVLELVSKVTSLLLNLVHSRPASCKNVVELDIDTFLLQTCNLKNNEFFNYANEAVNRFKSLTKERKLIGNIYKFADLTKTCLKTRLHEEMKLDGSLAITYSNSISCYQMELFDTTNSEQDIVVKEELQKAGLIWCGIGSGNVSKIWDNVTVLRVTPTLQFFAHVGEKMLDSLKSIQSKLNSSDAKVKLDSAPEVGQYICCRHTRAEDSDYIRGLVVSRDGRLVKVLAVDYGNMMSVPVDSLFMLQEDLINIAPQICFCSLKGIRPPPVNEELLVTVLQTVCTLCQDVTTAEHVIQSKEYAVNFFDLCECSSLKIAELAMSIIANVSRSKRRRQKLGDVGAVKRILGVCRSCASTMLEDDIRVILAGLQALTNLLFECPENQQIFTDLSGLEFLLQNLGRKENDGIYGAVIKTLRVFVGQVGLSRSIILEMERMSVQSDGMQPSKSRESRRRPRNRRQVPRRRSESPPRTMERMYGGRSSYHRTTSRSRLAKTESSSDEERRPRRWMSGESDSGETIIQRKVSKSTENLVVMDAAQHYKESIESVFFIQGFPVKIRNDATHELRPTPCASKISRNTISRIAVSFLNSGKGGSIFFGIDEESTVQGLKVDRNARDEFRLGVDRLLNRFTPPVVHTMYEMFYTPVVFKKGNDDPATREYVPDHYVIEIKLAENYNKMYTTPDNKCYFRFGANTRQVTTQELREQIIIEQEQKHLAEMRRLQQLIDKQSGKISVYEETE